MTDLLASWNQMHYDRRQVDEYLEYLDLKNEMKKGTIPVEKRRDGRFLVEFRNVSFRYPESDRYAIRNLNVKLEIGERMALVGRNGSGKTTFYKDAPFVILDEPTAALDPIAENEIYTGFHEIIGNKTALFISHRLSACRFSKEILVFENGNVVQRGSHEELAEQEGLYRRMWQAQAQYYQ